MLRALAPDRFVIDGELAIPDGDTLSFDALQMRLHPAESRIRKLSVETPAILILFDCLMTPDDEVLLGEPLARPPRGAGDALPLLRRSRWVAAFALHPQARAEAPQMARQGRRLARRRDREAGRRAVRLRRARDAEGQAPAHRRLRRRRLPLRDEQRSRRVAAARALQRRGQARPRRLHVDDLERRALGADEAAREAQRGLRASPATPPAVRAAGRPSARPNGSRSGPSSSSRCATTTSPAAASATAPSSCAGGPTRRRSSAPSSRCRRRPARVSSSARSWRREWQKTATRSRSRACG